MAEKEKSNLYLLAIVGIVAVVGIVVLVLNVGKASTYVAEEETLAGEAISSSLIKPDLVITKIRNIDVRNDLGAVKVTFVVTNKGINTLSAGTGFGSDVDVEMTSGVYSGITFGHGSTYATLKSPLKPRSTIVQEIEIELTDEGLDVLSSLGEEESVDTRFIYTVDYDDDVKESNELNNVYRESTGITPTSDDSEDAYY